MNQAEHTATRGRPRTITPERIAAAGIQLGLPNISYAGIASALGVSHMAIYKHVANLEELKRLVAEEIFRRWEIPPCDSQQSEGLQGYLQIFSASVQAFVRATPGITPYVIRRSMATQSMLDKIDSHQQQIALAYALTQEQARDLLSTVAFHCLAVADTVYSVAGSQSGVTEVAGIELAELEARMMQGMRVLISGALGRLESESEHAS